MGQPMSRFGLLVAAIVLVLDQASKAWILDGLRLHEVGRIELSPVFDLSFVRNYGVSFGMLQAESDAARWGLVLLSAVISCVFFWWLRTADRRLTALSLGLVIGGAIGNVIDRVRFGYVVDFLDFQGLFFPWVFNVADAAITIGAGALILDFFLHGEARPKSAT